MFSFRGQEFFIFCLRLLPGSGAFFFIQGKNRWVQSGFRDLVAPEIIMLFGPQVGVKTYGLKRVQGFDLRSF